MESTKRISKAAIAVLIVSSVILAVVAAHASGVLSAEGGKRKSKRARGRPPVAFRDVTRSVGLGSAPSPTWGSVWADHDRDGWPDLLVVRHKRKARLFDNHQGRYLSSPDESSFEPPGDRWYYDRHSCAWGEADGDGEPDLFCVSGAQKGAGSGPNQLLLGTGKEVAANAGVQDPAGRGRSLNWIDFDSDGDLDLFLTNEIRRGYPNRMFRNDGGIFTPVDVGLTDERASTSSAWSDWDRDGDPDLLVLGHGLRGSSAYENRDGRFVEIHMDGVSGQTWKSGTFGDYDGDGFSDLSLVDDRSVMILHNVAGTMELNAARVLRGGRSSAWLDVDNDGDLDLFVVQGIATGSNTRSNEPDQLLINRDGRFRATPGGPVGPTSGDGDAVAAVDSDRDGRVDLFVTNGSGEADRGRWILWRNRSRARHWVGLRLHGGRRNPFGFGAKVRITTTRSVIWSEATDQTYGKVQSDPGYVHIGLGSSLRADVMVLWPDGSRDCYQTAADQVTLLVRGGPPCF